MTVRERIEAARTQVAAAHNVTSWRELHRILLSAESELREALRTLDQESIVDALPPGDPRRR